MGREKLDNRGQRSIRRPAQRVPSTHALLEVLQRLGESLELEPVLAAVLDATRRLFAADRAGVWQADGVDRPVCLASFGLSAACIAAMGRLGPEFAALRQANPGGLPTVIPDVAAVPPALRVGILAADEGARAVAILPLSHATNQVGALIIMHDRPHPYGDEEIKAGRTLASHVAMAIDHARVYQAAQARAQEVEALLVAASQILGSLDLSTTLNSILDGVVRLTASDFVGIALLDAEGTTLRYEAACGSWAEQLKGATLRLGEGLTGTAAEQGQVISSPDVWRDPRWAYLPATAGTGARSGVFVPMRSRERLIGVLAAMSREASHFAVAHERLLTGLAAQAALAIEHARLFAEVGKLEALREVDRLKSQFISTVSHELRTPLSLIYGYAEILTTRDPPPAETRPMIEAIFQGAEQLRQLVDDVIDTAEIEQGRLTLQFDEIELHDLLAKTVAEVAGRTASHALTLDMPPDRMVIRGDAVRLRQVIMNLLSNAIRYTPNGGTIAVRAMILGDQAQVSVADQGIGLAPEQLRRMFERFYRAPSAVMHEQPGLGLGLAISRYIVEAQGGKIWAESPGLGQGSTFYFTLPLL